jgi:MATE family multidrug resistance protein
MHRKILRLALPNIISNITVPLLGIVDLAVVGHLEGVWFIGAVALGSTIFNFVYWSFGFLRMSTSGMAAQMYGAKDEKGAREVLQRSLLTGLLAGMIILLLQVPIDKISFYLLEGSEKTEHFASRYFFIRIWAAPATLILYALNGWFLGMQNAKYPMIVTLVINLLNIALDFLFVNGLHMNSDGVALGTLLANYAGLATALWLLFRKYPDAAKALPLSTLLNTHKFRAFFGINFNIFLRTMCLILVFTFFTARSAVYGDNILAVNTLLLQFFMFFSFFMDGFAYAAEALTGRYYGAADRHLLKKSVRSLFFWGIILSIPFSLVYLVAGEEILSLLTDNRQILQAARPFLLWVAMIPLISFPAFLWDGIYIGATSSAGMRNTMLFSTLFVFFPVWYLTQESLGNHSLWLALVLFLISRGITMGLFSKRYIFTFPKQV